MKILCVEDDENLIKLLKTTLTNQRYQVEVATDGRSGWELAEAFAYDLILLDLVLPNLDGIHFCQKLRSSSTSAAVNHDTPVLLMTALDTATNKVMGLDAGADDYVTKPLNLDEVMARIRALLRRTQVKRSPLLTWGNLHLNPSSCEVTFRGQPVLLASKEYEILELFLRNPDQIFSPSRLIDSLWLATEIPTESTVRSHIKGLRQKLKQAGAEEIFETLYKQGYRLKPEVGRGRGEEGGGDGGGGQGVALAGMDSADSASLHLSALWQECRQDYCDRVLVIQKAAIALQAGNLSEQGRHQAEREAHTLVGSLGSFGLEAASQLARQIQQLLQSKELSNRSNVEQLGKLIAGLYRQVAGEEEQQAGEVDRRSAALSPASIYLASVLIVAEEKLARSLATEAIAWEIQTQTATNLEQARHNLKQQLPDAIMLDLNLANSHAVGLAFLAEVRTQYPHLPVLVLTAEESLTQRVEATRLGCQCFLQKSSTPAQTLAAVAQVLPQSTQSTAHLLLVDDDPHLLQLLHSLLTPHGYQVTLLDQPQQFWQTLEQTTPDLVILDIDLDGYGGLETIAPLNGIDLCQVIRSDPRWNRLPVLLLSAHTDAETMHRGFVARADDFLPKPVVATELLTRIQTRLEQRKRWDVGDMDELTGVSLRRKTLQDLTRLLQLAKRQRQPLTIAILDLDHFKRVNDQYGHKMGDRVLHHFGRLLLRSFRAEDVIGRWGGEEFVVGMYGITQQDGAKRITEVLHQMRQDFFTEPNIPPFVVTFSAGVAQAGDRDDWQTLYQRADKALYQAKAQGRNCIVVAGD